MTKYIFKQEHTNILGNLISVTEKIITAECYSDIFAEITNFLKASGLPTRIIQEYYQEEIAILNEENKINAEYYEMTNKENIRADECNE